MTYETDNGIKPVDPDLPKVLEPVLPSLPREGYLDCDGQGLFIDGCDGQGNVI